MINSYLNKKVFYICDDRKDYILNNNMSSLTYCEDFLLFKKDFICPRYSIKKSYAFKLKMKEIMDSHRDLLESLRDD